MDLRLVHTYTDKNYNDSDNYISVHTKAAIILFILSTHCSFVI